jgi:hypothetical protein
VMAGKLALDKKVIVKLARQGKMVPAEA